MNFTLEVKLAVQVFFLGVHLIPAAPILTLDLSPFQIVTLLLCLGVISVPFSAQLLLPANASYVY